MKKLSSFKILFAVLVPFLLFGFSSCGPCGQGFPYNFDKDGRTNAMIFVVDTVYEFDSAGNTIAILSQLGPDGDIIRIANINVQKGDSLTLAMYSTVEEFVPDEPKADQSVVEDFNWDDTDSTE
jgi:hypothetical protein